MPARTVLLFYPNHSYCCVLPHVYHYSCNCTAPVTCHRNSSNNSVPLMFTAIAERPAVRGWALKVTGSGGTVSWWGIVLYWQLYLVTQTLSRWAAVSTNRRTFRFHLARHAAV